MATPRRVKKRHAGPKVWVVRSAWMGKRVTTKWKTREMAQLHAQTVNICRLTRSLGEATIADSSATSKLVYF